MEVPVSAVAKDVPNPLSVVSMIAHGKIPLFVVPAAPV
jgi:hypothetical protein